MAHKEKRLLYVVFDLYCVTDEIGYLAKKQDRGIFYQVLA